MGVKGLLSALGPLTLHPDTAEDTLRQFRHQTLAIDLSAWLYKGAYGCAIELGTNRPTSSYVNYVMHRLRLLKYYQIQSILVADNEATLMKAETEAARRAGKEEKRSLGYKLLSEASGLPNGHLKRETMKKAEAAFQGCISVTRAMVHAAFQAAVAENFKVMFAPCEADAQLAYLCACGQAQGVITEDSDLVVYSVISPKPFPLLLKMDKFGKASKVELGLLSDDSQCSLADELLEGNGDDSDGDDSSSESIDSLDEIVSDNSVGSYDESQNSVQGEDTDIVSSRAKQSSCAKRSKKAKSEPTAASASKGRARPGKNQGRKKAEDKDPASKGTFVTRLANFRGSAGKRMFVQMAVLAGCDYLDSLPGLGLKTAQRLLLKHAGANPDERISLALETHEAARGAQSQARARKAGSFEAAQGQPGGSSDELRGYLERARQAEASFFFAQVLDPVRGVVVHFSELEALEPGAPFPRPARAAARPCLRLGVDPELLLGRLRTAEELELRLRTALCTHPTHAQALGSSRSSSSSSSSSSSLSSATKRATAHQPPPPQGRDIRSLLLRPSTSAVGKRAFSSSPSSVGGSMSSAAAEAVAAGSTADEDDFAEMLRARECKPGPLVRFGTGGSGLPANPGSKSTPSCSYKDVWLRSIPADESGASARGSRSGEDALGSVGSFSSPAERNSRLPSASKATPRHLNEPSQMYTPAVRTVASGPGAGSVADTIAKVKVHVALASVAATSSSSVSSAHDSSSASFSPVEGAAEVACARGFNSSDESTGSADHVPTLRPPSPGPSAQGRLAPSVPISPDDDVEFLVCVAGAGQSLKRKAEDAPSASGSTAVTSEVPKLGMALCGFQSTETSVLNLNLGSVRPLSKKPAVVVSKAGPKGGFTKFPTNDLRKFFNSKPKPA